MFHHVKWYTSFLLVLTLIIAPMLSAAICQMFSAWYGSCNELSLKRTIALRQYKYRLLWNTLRVLLSVDFSSVYFYKAIKNTVERKHTSQPLFLDCSEIGHVPLEISSFVNFLTVSLACSYPSPSVICRSPGMQSHYYGILWLLLQLNFSRTCTTFSMFA